MFLRKVKYGSTTYYYLARKIKGEDKHELLVKLGSLKNPTLNQEDILVKNWASTIVPGGERSLQKIDEKENLIMNSRINETGRTFDLDKCIAEFRQIYKKYGAITKPLLEKTARPNKEISWGTTTILNQLRNRGLTLKQAFEMAKKIT